MKRAFPLVKAASVIPSTAMAGTGTIRTEYPDMKRLMALALLAGAALVITPGSAAAGPSDNALLVNKHAQRCLNAPGDQASVVITRNCGGGWGFDRWNVVPDGNAVRIVRADRPHLCLEIIGYSTQNAAAATLFTCYGGSNQRWYESRQDDGSFVYRNVASNRCLDAREPIDWGAVYQWACHYGNEQRWFKQ